MTTSMLAAFAIKTDADFDQLYSDKSSSVRSYEVALGKLNVNCHTDVLSVFAGKSWTTTLLSSSLF